MQNCYIERWEELVYHQHDEICNQKYGEDLPYSFHLKWVKKQAIRFLHLIENKDIPCKKYSESHTLDTHTVVVFSAIGHDLIEDSRMSYNDIVKSANSVLSNQTASEMVADIIYAVTDEKGKNRKERKSEKYYKELASNKLAVFVKLSDIASNTLFSKMIGSKMYDTYKKEFTIIEKNLYVKEFEEMFEYIRNM